jgi:transposase
MSCTAVAKVLLLDDDTIRTWHRLYAEEGIEGLASFGYEGSACRLSEAQRNSQAPPLDGRVELPKRQVTEIVGRPQIRAGARGRAVSQD